MQNIEEFWYVVLKVWEYTLNKYVKTCPDLEFPIKCVTDNVNLNF